MFAAHPAWGESRNRVRERAAPAYTWNAFVFASRPAVHEFSPRARVVPGVSITMLDVNVTQPLVRRATLLLTGAASDAEVRALAAVLDAGGVEHVWLSHPRDWTSSRSDLSWAPAGRDARNRSDRAMKRATAR